MGHFVVLFILFFAPAPSVFFYRPLFVYLLLFACQLTGRGMYVGHKIF